MHAYFQNCCFPLYGIHYHWGEHCITNIAYKVARHTVLVAKHTVLVARHTVLVARHTVLVADIQY